MTSMRILASRICLFISLVWLGMILGISFLEAPVKFMAPSVTLPVGLDIGRHVFGVFNKVEIGLSLATFGLFLMTRSGLRYGVLLAAAWSALAVESAWLLPVLDQRVTIILEGQLPPATFHHRLYILLEIVKVTALAAYGLLVLGVIMPKTAPGENP